jgi:hypothetical protein
MDELWRDPPEEFVRASKRVAWTVMGMIAAAGAIVAMGYALYSLGIILVGVAVMILVIVFARRWVVQLDRRARVRYGIQEEPADLALGPSTASAEQRWLAVLCVANVGATIAVSAGASSAVFAINLLILVVVVRARR